MVKDRAGVKAQVFGLGAGKTISLGNYSPIVDEVVTLGSAVTITLDDVPIEYPALMCIALYASKTYIFSVATPVHVM